MDETFSKTPWYFMVVRWLCISWGIVEKASARIFPSQWVLKGGCKKTGACCKLIAMELPHFTVHPWAKPLYWLFCTWGVWWNEKINGFTFAGVMEKRWLGFTCKRLASNNLCLDYKRRPRICRDYPVIKYFGKPVLAKGCGFSCALRPTKPKLYKG